MDGAPHIDLEGADYERRPYAVIDELRRSSWFARNKTGYVFFDQQDAMHVLRSPDFRFSYFFIDPADNAYLADRVQGVLLAKHGGDHRRLRALVAMALRDRVVESLREGIGRIVDDLIDALPRDGRVDLVPAFTQPFPTRILGPMLGIAYDEVEGIDEWITVSARNVDPTVPKSALPAIAEAWSKLEDFLLALLEERRGNLGSDIFSELIGAEVEGDRLRPDELIGLASELARAGVETTRRQMTLTLHALLRHPEQWEKLQADPGLAAGTVEEGLRFAPLPQIIPQQAVRDLDYRGLPIKAGEVVMVLIPAANRDPGVFERAADFDIAREPHRHLSLGFGTHFCSGAQLARLEMTAALEGLARRVRSWRLAAEPELGPVLRGSVPLSLEVDLVRE